MAQLLSLSRAAQLIGVTRGDLQKKIRDGELAAYDGLVDGADLQRVYPALRLEESGAFERVAQIKEQAFSRRMRERLLPSQEVLAQRLFAQSQELADLRRHLQHYHALVVELRDTIGAALAADPDSAVLQALSTRARGGLARVLATEPVNPLDAMDDMLKVMCAQVTVRPSGHQFSVEGHDTLLQAGLHAGLKFNYGCGNGTCGMCKVRVTSGQVSRVMPTDYPLSEAERAQGYVLLCAHTAASSELTIESLEAQGPDDIPEQRIVTTVRALRPLAPDTLLLHLQTPRTHRLRFLAGQAVTLALAGGDDAHATHSVASCPCDDRNLHFYVPRREGDALAAGLFDGRLKPGDSVTVRGPEGRFVLDEAPLPLVFAACDIGFAPVKSLVEHALSLDAAPSIALFWLATRPDGHFMANQCRAWGEALDHFEVSLVQHADAATGASQMAAAMRADLFDIDSAFYVAGPAAFVDTLGAELLAAGVPRAQIHSEVVA